MGCHPFEAELGKFSHRIALEGYFFQHVQAIMIAIDQYAETALGKRGHFLNRPHSVGGIGAPTQGG
jgi:hypothetical protein